MIVDSMNVMLVSATTPRPPELPQDQSQTLAEMQSLNALSSSSAPERPESVSDFSITCDANIFPSRRIVSETNANVQQIQEEEEEKEKEEEKQHQGHQQQQQQQQQRSDGDGARGGSCCYFADDMAGDDQRAEKYILDIPFSVLLNIYQSLDADKGWERLAAETGYSFDKIKLLELEGARNQGSPGRSLLWELGSRNTTVRQLYGYLSTLSRYREMKILEDYVNNTAKLSFVDNGLKGLKSPDSSMDTSDSLKGLKHNSMSMSSKMSNNSKLSNSNFNFNPPPPSSDVNNSMKCQEKEKHYSGKQMPVATSVSSAVSRSEAPQSPGSMQVPGIRPSNPSQRVPTSDGVNLIQSMIKQMPDGARNSSPSAGHPVPGFPASHCASASSPSSTSFPTSESPFSSSLSSLPGLESSLDTQMAVMGSACFSYSEILAATNGFDERNKIGEGAFGKVYYGVLRQNKCAVKKMFEAAGQETVVERSTRMKRELTSLLKFRHENIVTLYGYAMDGETLCLIYQLMHNGSLEDRLMCKDNTAPLVWSQRLNIMLGTCQGLNFLHNLGEQPLIHGDIKSANILLDKHMEAKISDLGQAQQATAHSADSNTSRHTHITREHTTTKLYGTRAYQPAEVQSGGRPSVKSDVFSMGVVLLEVFSGERAYDERREGESFLGDYFSSLKNDSGDEACLSKIDRRGGECPREVALAFLNLAHLCISPLKRQRPKTDQLLQKMTDIDEMYREKTGIKHTNMDSLPGSEHSCHLSHTSSVGGSVDNLSAAPPRHLPHPGTFSQSSGTSDLNLNTDSSHDLSRPDNRLAVNIDVDAAAKHVSQGSLSSSSSSSCLKGPGKPNPVDNPMKYLPKDQPLPPAFCLQQAYDNQSLNQAERRRISRLSQCYQMMEERAQQEGGAGEAEVLPQTDPVKLAQLEQFDRMNLGGSAHEKESNSLQSDPKKLAQLKQFDDQAHLPAQQNIVGDEDEAGCEGGSLACDPRKLAQLRQFDEDNIKASNIVQQSQREEAKALASDPRKLAALTQFDTAKSERSVVMSPSPRDEAMHAGELASESKVTNNDLEDTSLVSQMDYLVTSQREALEACNSMIQQQEHVPQQLNVFQSSLAESETCANSCPETHRPEPSAFTADSPAPKQQDSNASPQGSPAPTEKLLLRQKNFFDLYNRLAENVDDDEDSDDEDLEDEDFAGEERETDDVEEQAEQNCSNAVVFRWAGVGPSSSTSQDTLPVKKQVAARAASGLCHCPTPPAEQDKSMLNYFKQREQHCEKTFKKPAQTSQC